MTEQEQIEMWEDRCNDLQKDLEYANDRIEELEDAIKDFINTFEKII